MKTTVAKTIIEKQQSKGFGKNVYLLGKDKDGIRYWLEEPKWDCGWYWGFGYVETYQRNVIPSRARDIESHTHISGLMGAQEVYDFDKKAFVKSEYVHNIFDNALFEEITFNEKDGWILSELFKTFYHLRESAAVFGRVGSHLTTNPCKSVIENKEFAKHINEVMIPAITSEIIKMLTPKD